MDIQAHTELMAAFPARLQALIQGVSREALYHRPGPQEWSIVEVIGHLEDVDALFMGRVHAILTTDQPAFIVYEPTEPVRRRDFQGQPFEAIQAIFEARRAVFVELLRSLTPEQQARTGTHPMHGVMSATRSVASVPTHDNTHYQQIANNLDHHGRQ